MPPGVHLPPHPPEIMLANLLVVRESKIGTNTKSDNNSHNFIKVLLFYQHIFKYLTVISSHERVFFLSGSYSSRSIMTVREHPFHVTIISCQWGKTDLCKIKVCVITPPPSSFCFKIVFVLGVCVYIINIVYFHTNDKNCYMAIFSPPLEIKWLQSNS